MGETISREFLHWMCKCSNFKCVESLLLFSTWFTLFVDFSSEIWILFCKNISAIFQSTLILCYWLNKRAKRVNLNTEYGIVSNSTPWGAFWENNYWLTLNKNVGACGMYYYFKTATAMKAVMVVAIATATVSARLKSYSSSHSVSVWMCSNASVREMKIM